VTRTITVGDGRELNDLTINARISNGRIVKAGAGVLLLNNASNTFTVGTDEVQSITLAGAPIFGSTTFTLTFNGSTTGTINYQTDAATTATNIQNALRALPGVGTSGVTVTAVSAFQYNVSYTGHLGSVDLPNTVSGTLVNAGGATAITGARVTAGLAGVRLNAGTLALGSDSALGSARLHIDATTQLLASGGNRTLANNITINPNITATFGGRRDFGGTNDLTLSGGVTLVGSTAAQTVTLDVPDPQTLVTISGVISGGGDLLVPTKQGIGTLVLSGNNTFDTRNASSTAAQTGSDGVRVTSGVLRLAHRNALGSATQPASISIRGDAGAVLEFDGTTINGSVNVNNFVLDISGIDSGLTRGFLNRTSTEAVHTGIIRNLGGNNSVTAPASLAEVRLRSITDGTTATSIFFGSDAGTLDLVAGINGYENDATPTVANNRTLYKTGAGSIRTSGSTANGITGGYLVMNGALDLNKDTVGVNETQRIVFAAATTSDSRFTLSFGGHNANVSGGADAATTALNIQTQLNLLPSIAGNGGSVSVVAVSASDFRVTFQGLLGSTNLPDLISGTDHDRSWRGDYRHGTDWWLGQ